MKAHAVNPAPVAPSLPHSNSHSAPDSTASRPFGHQLRDAAQRHAPRDDDHSPMSPKNRESGGKARLSNDHQVNAPKPADAQAPSTTTAAAAAPYASEAGQADAPDANKASMETTEVDDSAASALAGAMLALIAPAAAGVLRPAGAAAGAAGVLAQNGKAAVDAGTTMLLSPGVIVAASTAVVDAAPTTVASMLSAVDGLLPIATRSKDAPSTDPIPNAAMIVPATQTAPAVPVLQLASPVGSHAFAQDLGQQVAWLGGQNIKQARIRLHPEELGSLDVSVSVAHGRVDVVINAHHPAAVTAVQQSLPQLDHMLAQHGLSLGHAEVGQQHRDNGGRHAAADTAALDEVGDVQNVSMSPGKVGLLDAFA